MAYRPGMPDGRGHKHLYTIHECACGKLIRGNAYYSHKRRCKARRLAEAQELTPTTFAPWLQDRIAQLEADLEITKDPEIRSFLIQFIAGNRALEGAYQRLANSQIGIEEVRQDFEKSVHKMAQSFSRLRQPHIEVHGRRRYRTIEDSARVIRNMALSRGTILDFVAESKSRRPLKKS